MMKTRILSVVSAVLFCTGPSGEAVAAADEPDLLSIYTKISNGLRYSTGGRHKGRVDTTRGHLRIPKEKTLVVIFDFDKIDFGQLKLPASLCITIAKDGANPTSKPVPLSKGTEVTLNDMGYSSSDPPVDYGVNLGLSPTCGAAATLSKSFAVRPVSSAKAHLSVSDAFLIGALTQLAPIRDPNVDDPPNRHFQCCRVGANIFFFPPEAGWLGRSVGLNVTGLDFDGKSRPSVGVIVAIPKTDRSLFVGWGYNFRATRVQHKGYFFLGTSFIGIKDWIDPGGKHVGSPN